MRGPPRATPTYRTDIAADAERLTPAQIAQWSRADPGSAPPAPVFIVGFPRSGTTLLELLDTLLTGMPQLHVLEELPVLIHVEAALGGLDRLAGLTRDRAVQLRRRYFELLGQLSPPPPGATVVDKHPLHMARIPLIHRLFPDARIILVERHPCDAVLSCFMANFQLNDAMREFVTLEGAGAAIRYRVRSLDARHGAAAGRGPPRPLRADGRRPRGRDAPAARIPRPALGRARARQSRGLGQARAYPHRQLFAGHRADLHACRRPLERYRDQMAGVLPLLAPWAERMGYEI
ncbi:MAG: sulfotransferase [Sphingomonas sp.]